MRVGSENMGITKSIFEECKKKELGSLIALLLHSDHSRRATYFIRKAEYLSSKKGVIRKLRVRRYLSKLVTDYGIFIHPDTRIGIGLKLPHPNGIIIGKAVSIGENVTIYQQVTIGSSNIGDWKLNKQPSVGNNVILFSGCKVIGDVSIADGVTIAANAVVTKSIYEENSVWAGVPAKLIK